MCDQMLVSGNSKFAICNLQFAILPLPPCPLVSLSPSRLISPTLPHSHSPLHHLPLLLLIFAFLSGLSGETATKEVLPQKEEKPSAELDLKERLAALEQLNKRVQRLAKKKEFKQAILLADAVFATRKKLLGTDNLDVAASMSVLADLYSETGDFVSAARHYRSTLELRSRLMGASHPEALTIMNRLADSLMALRQFKEALPLLKKNLEIHIRYIGEEHPNVARTMDSLAYVYQETGNDDEALKLWEKVLAIRQKILGYEHVDVAETLTNLAMLLERKNRTRMALMLHQSALAIRLRLLGKHHLDVGESLYNIAYVHLIRRDHQKAFPRAEKALAIRKKSLGTENLLVADCLDMLANIHLLRSEFEKALPVCKEALRIREKLTGPEHSDMAESLNHLAKVYDALGKRQEAVPLYEQSLNMRRKLLGSDAPEALESMNELADIYRELGKVAEAVSLYESALKIARRTTPGDSMDMAARFDTLARLYQQQGQYQKALPLQRDALNIYRLHLGSNHKEIMSRTQRLGEIYISVGMTEEALQLYQHLLDGRRKALGEIHADTIKSMVTLAGLHETLGDYPKAVALLQAALAAQRKSLNEDHQDITMTIRRLALIYETLDETEQALTLYRSVLARLKKQLGVHHPDVAETLSHMSGLYLNKKEFDKAVLACRSALEIRQKLYGENHPDVATSLNNLANLLRLMGDLFKARDYYDSSLKIFRKFKGENHPDLTTIYHNLAILLAKMGDRVRAYDLLKKTIAIEDDVLQHLLPVIPEPRTKEFFNGLQTTTSLVFSLLTRSSARVRSGDSKSILEFAWKRKQLLNDFSLPVQEMNTPSAGTRRLQQQLRAAQRLLANLIFSPPPDLEEKEFSKQHSELMDEIRELEIRLASQEDFQKFSHRRLPVSVDQVLAKLPQNAALVEFLAVLDFDFIRERFNRRHYFALTLTHTQGVKMFNLGAAEKLEAQVLRLLGQQRDEFLKQSTGVSLSVSDLTETGFDYGRRLHELLIEPLRLHMAGATEIYLAPDGVLHLVPFEALRRPSGRFMGDDFKCRTLLSGRQLVERQAKTSGGPAVFFAAPVFGEVKKPETGESSVEAETVVSFQAMPETRMEVEAVISLGVEAREREVAFPQMISFYGEDAGVRNLLFVKYPRLLHLGTHAFLLKERLPGLGPPLGLFQNSPFQRAGLALAGANGNTESDGSKPLFTAESIASLRLNGTELVVLPGCDVGPGSEDIGESLYALRRAFQAAGATNVLHSLWSVPVKPRRRFVLEFYRQLLINRQSPYDAFQTAKKKLREYPGPSGSGKEKDKTNKNRPFAHPFYWSGFVLVENGG